MVRSRLDQKGDLMAESRPVGASFVFQPVLSARIFTPEQFTDEHRQFRDVAKDFATNEIEPHVDDIEHKKPGVMVDLMRKAAELGLFTVEIPEEYGGLDLDKRTSMLIAEALATVGSFAVTYGAHTGIGTLPIVYYGTHEQKQRYLPKLATGEMMGAYALSEAGSGSDALAAKTVAKLSDDGSHYVLNGTKSWITNASWAHLFTVFAQIDGDKFSAFLVERATDGVTIGTEEHKLGIRGSSTCQVILDDVKVPAENLLGEVGRGHKIAFNILNIGRWKLGLGSMGTAKVCMGYGIKYAKERKQFKKPIATFGLIRQKIARSAILVYATESMAYRLGGCLDTRAAELDKKSDSYQKDMQDVSEDFTIEASILKIFGSEALAEVADEMLQIHGGNGYTEDYPMERMYRDARINRIFEGTNEINRLIIPATLFKRAIKGQIPLMPFTAQVASELEDPSKLPKKGDGPLADEVWALELSKRALVYQASSAAQKYMADLKEKQRILGALADCISDLYAMDSVIARAAQAIEDKGEDAAAVHVALARLYCFDARVNVFHRLRRVAMMMAEGDELDKLYDNLGKLDERYRIDFMGLQDRVAAHMIEAEGYSV